MMPRRSGGAFPLFDVVWGVSDHSCLTKLEKQQPNCLPILSRDVHKMIMREWKILEESLPDSIYVRVYEERIDLMTAVIVGSQGTPYHDGLYFFDIRFPHDYPQSPPTVRYVSFGMRINPNLYPDGDVCLSLINTWSGGKTEVWIPGQSTILQLLISIQALVLNEEPYYNEPYVMGAFWSGVLFRRNMSYEYNERTFLLCCKTMLHLLRRPPRNFESFVTWHFRERGSKILSAVMAYRNGECRIGYYGICGGDGSSRKGEAPSGEFRFSTRKLVPQLALAFAKAGAPVCARDFLEQLEGEAEEEEEEERRVVCRRPWVVAPTCVWGLVFVLAALVFLIHAFFDRD